MTGGASAKPGGKAKVPGATDLVAANCSDGHAHTSPVGSFKANAFGLHDMHGNAWEWVQDVAHENYHGAPGDGSSWNSGGNQDHRMNRGGSWGANPAYLRSAIRSMIYPDTRGFETGMRIARTN